MIRCSLTSRAFYDTTVFETIYRDYLKWNSLSKEEQNKIEEEFRIIKSEETPALALKKHGTLPPENWLEITEQMRKRMDDFYDAHPYFLLNHVVLELKSIVDAKNITIVHTPRKGRASIKEVSILQNGEYLIFIYNRLVNSSQTSVVYSGVPLKYIDLIDSLHFLSSYIPNEKYNFSINRFLEFN